MLPHPLNSGSAGIISFTSHSFCFFDFTPRSVECSISCLRFFALGSSAESCTVPLSSGFLRDVCSNNNNYDPFVLRVPSSMFKSYFGFTFFSCFHYCIQFSFHTGSFDSSGQPRWRHALGTGRHTTKTTIHTSWTEMLQLVLVRERSRASVRGLVTATSRWLSNEVGVKQDVKHPSFEGRDEKNFPCLTRSANSTARSCNCCARYFSDCRRIVVQCN